MNDTNLIQIAQQLQASGLISQSTWHGLTAMHALLVVIAGWVTHANWNNVLAAWTWYKREGALWGILKAAIIGDCKGKASTIENK
jgi:hypothetical protein